MPCHTRMKPIIHLQGLLWLYLLGLRFMVASLEPGFLDFDNLPDTNFTCVGKVIGGYYADLETSCQMFHVCTIGQLDEPMDIRFLCLNGTVFDQETRVCERIDEVDCSKSEQFYSLNLELYGNTQPPILEESPETDPPEIQKHPLSTTTTTTTTQKPKPKTTRPSFIITTTPRAPTTTLEQKILLAQQNSPDIRFNPEEINISLNPGAPPNIRPSKPISFQQQSFSDSNKRVIVTTHSNSYKPKLTVTTQKSYEVLRQPTEDSYSYAYHTDYQTEHPGYHHFRPSFRPEIQEYKPSTYRSSIYHAPTTQNPMKIHPYSSQHGPTTYRNHVYNSPLKPSQPYFHRTEKPPRIQLPLPLIPTLSPLTFSSPAPFSLNRHIETKRFADHHQPPRIVISASASVSDASGRKFNYSLGTIGDSRFFGHPPASYDDYKEDDVGLDPFYHDVPKIRRLKRNHSKRRRHKRSAQEEPIKFNSEQEAIEVLRFLVDWYSKNREQQDTQVSYPINTETITDINNQFTGSDIPDYVGDDIEANTAYETNKQAGGGLNNLQILKPPKEETDKISVNYGDPTSPTQGSSINYYDYVDDNYEPQIFKELQINETKESQLDEPKEELKYRQEHQSFNISEGVISVDSIEKEQKVESTSVEATTSTVALEMLQQLGSSNMPEQMVVDGFGDDYTQSFGLNSYDVNKNRRNRPLVKPQHFDDNITELDLQTKTTISQKEEPGQVVMDRNNDDFSENVDHEVNKNRRRRPPVTPQQLENVKGIDLQAKTSAEEEDYSRTSQKVEHEHNDDRHNNDSSSNEVNKNRRRRPPVNQVREDATVVENSDRINSAIERTSTNPPSTEDVGVQKENFELSSNSNAGQNHKEQIVNDYEQSLKENLTYNEFKSKTDELQNVKRTRVRGRGKARYTFQPVPGEGTSSSSEATSTSGRRRRPQHSRRIISATIEPTEIRKRTKQKSSNTIETHSISPPNTTESENRRTDATEKTDNIEKVFDNDENDHQQKVVSDSTNHEINTDESENSNNPSTKINSEPYLEKTLPIISNTDNLETTSTEDVSKQKSTNVEDSATRSNTDLLITVDYDETSGIADDVDQEEFHEKPKESIPNNIRSDEEHRNINQEELHEHLNEHFEKADEVNQQELHVNSEKSDDVNQEFNEEPKESVPNNINRGEEHINKELETSKKNYSDNRPTTVKFETLKPTIEAQLEDPEEEISQITQNNEDTSSISSEEVDGYVQKLRELEEKLRTRVAEVSTVANSSPQELFLLENASRQEFDTENADDEYKRIFIDSAYFKEHNIDKNIKDDIEITEENIKPIYVRNRQMVQSEMHNSEKSSLNVDGPTPVESREEPITEMSKERPKETTVKIANSDVDQKKSEGIVKNTSLNPVHDEISKTSNLKKDIDVAESYPTETLTVDKSEDSNISFDEKQSKTENNTIDNTQEDENEKQKSKLEPHESSTENPQQILSEKQEQTQTENSTVTKDSSFSTLVSLQSTIESETSRGRSHKRRKYDEGVKLQSDSDVRQSRKNRRGRGRSRFQYVQVDNIEIKPQMKIIGIDNISTKAYKVENNEATKNEANVLSTNITNLEETESVLSHQKQTEINSVASLENITNPSTIKVQAEETITTAPPLTTSPVASTSMLHSTGVEISSSDSKMKTEEAEVTTLIYDEISTITPEVNYFHTSESSATVPEKIASQATSPDLTDKSPNEDVTVSSTNARLSQIEYDQSNIQLKNLNVYASTIRDELSSTQPRESKRNEKLGEDEGYDYLGNEKPESIHSMITTESRTETFPTTLETAQTVDFKATQTTPFIEDKTSELPNKTESTGRSFASNPITRHIVEDQKIGENIETRTTVGKHFEKLDVHDKDTETLVLHDDFTTSRSKGRGREGSRRKNKKAHDDRSDQSEVLHNKRRKKVKETTKDSDITKETTNISSNSTKDQFESINFSYINSTTDKIQTTLQVDFTQTEKTEGTSTFHTTETYDRSSSTETTNISTDLPTSIIDEETTKAQGSKLFTLQFKTPIFKVNNASSVQSEETTSYQANTDIFMNAGETLETKKITTGIYESSTTSPVDVPTETNTATTPTLASTLSRNQVEITTMFPQQKLVTEIETTTRSIATTPYNKRKRGRQRPTSQPSHKSSKKKPSIPEEIVDVIKHKSRGKEFNINAYTANLAYKNQEEPITSAETLTTSAPSFNCFDRQLNRFYSDPRDCRLFHYCTRGFTKTQLLDMKFVCDFGTFFDDEKLVCTKSRPARCF